MTCFSIKTRLHVWALGIALMLSGGVATTAQAEGSITVAGIRIIDKPYNDENGMRPFNWSAGTRVALLVEHDAGGLFSLDTEASQLKTFADDKGTNLLAGDSGFGEPGLEDDVSLSKDGQAMLIEVHGPTRPAAGAKQIRLRGKLAVQRAEDTETFKAENVKLEKGTQFTLGEHQFEITAMSESFGRPMVKFRSPISRDFIAEVKYLDGEGNDITGSGRFWSGDKRFGRTLKKDAKVDRATIQMKIRQNAETVTIPLKVDASVGL